MENTNNISYIRYMKDRNWRNLEQCKSLLHSELERVAVLNEEDITKKDLLLLITRNLDYVRALNMYNYYKDELSTLLMKRDLNKNEQD